MSSLYNASQKFGEAYFLFAKSIVQERAHKRSHDTSRSSYGIEQVKVGEICVDGSLHVWHNM